MPDLRDALFKAGLVDQDKLRKEEGLARVRDEIPMAKLRKRQSDIEKKMEALSDIDSPKRFRTQACTLLTDFPDPMLAEALLGLAGKNKLRKHPDEDGEALFTQLQQTLRGLRRTLSEGERVATVSRYLGRNR